ncbi:MAG: SAM-dependent methyltransferase [Bacteroidota bacterium]
MATTGTLFLIPVYLGASDANQLPLAVIDTAKRLRHFIVENEKTARAFLSSIRTPVPQQELSLTVLDEHTTPEEVPSLIAPLLEGIDCGLMSEAGCPGVADPGSAVVALAHHRGIRVVPLAGPSSILLGLMASGLNGQRFRFHGYLSRESGVRKEQLRSMEKEVMKSGETQLFIETPYRNQAMLEDLLAVLAPDTSLCIACDLASSSEMVLSKSISAWKSSKPDLHKRPCIFLIGESVISGKQSSRRPPVAQHRPPRNRR